MIKEKREVKDKWWYRFLFEKEYTAFGQVATAIYFFYADKSAIITIIVGLLIIFKTIGFYHLHFNKSEQKKIYIGADLADSDKTVFVVRDNPNQQ